MVRLMTTAAMAAAILLAGAASAQDPYSDDESDQASTVADAADADGGDYDPLKIICRRVQPPTGTRIISPQTRQTMCMSRADWDQQEEDAREVLKERDRGICAPSCGQ